MKFELDFNPIEATQVIIATKVLNTVVYGGLIVVTYKKHPLVFLNNKHQILSRLENRFPRLVNRGTQMYHSATNMAINSKMVSAFTKRFQLDQANLVHSLAEGSLLYKVCLPVILPTTFLLSYYGVEYYQKKQVISKAAFY